MRRALATLTVLLCALPLAACGDDSSDRPAGSAGAGASGDSTETKVIDVTFEGDSVTPNGERVEVAAGQPITLHVTADAPGEIHVHSTPEQELEYEKGETDVKLAPIDAPGTVDVESHHLEKVIVQLEVR